MLRLSSRTTIAPGFPFDPKRAAAYRRELERLQRIHKMLDPEIIVEQARPAASPIHECFTWDERKAAHERRLDQARKLLQAIHVYVYDPSPRAKNAEPIHVRVFHHVETTSNGKGSARHLHYATLAQVLSTPIYRKQILEQALREARSWVERYGHYRELAPAVKAIRLLLREEDGESRA